MTIGLPAITTLALSLALTAPLAAAEKERSEAGRALAERHCSECHAIGPTGDSPHEDAPPFRTFAKKWPLENLEESLAEGIVTGHPDMPAFVLEPDEIDALIEHLHTLALQEKEKASGN